MHWRKLRVLNHSISKAMVNGDVVTGYFTLTLAQEEWDMKAEEEPVLAVEEANTYVIVCQNDVIVKTLSCLTSGVEEWRTAVEEALTPSRSY
jgi:hypothetical protein